MNRGRNLSNRRGRGGASANLGTRSEDNQCNETVSKRGRNPPPVVEDLDYNNRRNQGCTRGRGPSGVEVRGRVPTRSNKRGHQASPPKPLHTARPVNYNRDHELLDDPMKPTSLVVASKLASMHRHGGAPSSKPSDGVLNVNHPPLGRYPASSSTPDRGLAPRSSNQNTAGPVQPLNHTPSMKLLRTALSQSPAPPPAKRRKPNVDIAATSFNSNGYPSPPITTGSSSVSPRIPAFTSKSAVPPPPIKREPSPSPPIQPIPRQITAGTKRYTPIPKNLLCSHHRFREHRAEWLKVKEKEMREAGLRPVKAFFREDGASIDWISEIPVMSDTLLPAPVVPENDGIQIFDPPPISQLAVPCSAVVQPASIRRPSPSVFPPHPESVAESVPSIETFIDFEPMQKGAQEFLRRYVFTFDKDRSSLASAYSNMSTLSCRVHRPTRSFKPSSASISSLFSSLDCGVKQGRLDILSALFSIDARFKFLTRERNGGALTFDVQWTGAPHEISLCCYGELIAGRESVSVDMSFVLRDTDLDEEDKSTEGLWSPFVAVTHQITFRDIKTFYR